MKMKVHITSRRIAGLLLMAMSLSARASLLDINYEFVSSTHNVLGTNVLGVSYQVDTSLGQMKSFAQYGYETFYMDVNMNQNPLVSLPADNGFRFAGYTETLWLLRDVDKTTGLPTSPWRNFGGTGPYQIGTWVVPDSQPNTNYYFQGGNATGYKIENWGATTWPYPTDIFSTVFATITELAPPAGSTPSNPITQTQSCATPTAECFAIPVTVNAAGLGVTSPIYIDPVVAIGYDYLISESGVFFDSVVIPEQNGLVAGTILELLIPGMVSQSLTVGTTFDFTDHGFLNLNGFTIGGIDPGLGLLPGDANAFVTGLTFAGADGTALLGQIDVTVSMNAVTSVPEPESYAMLLAGLALVAFAVRRHKA